MPTRTISRKRLAWRANSLHMAGTDSSRGTSKKSPPSSVYFFKKCEAAFLARVFALGGVKSLRLKLMRGEGMVVWVKDFGDTI